MPGTPYEDALARQAISSVPPERMAIPQAAEDAITRERGATDAADYVARQAVERDLRQKKFEVSQDKKYLATVRRQAIPATAIGIGNVLGAGYGSIEEFRTEREKDRMSTDLIFQKNLMRDIMAKGLEGVRTASTLPPDKVYPAPGVVPEEPGDPSLYTRPYGGQY